MRANGVAKSIMVAASAGAAAGEAADEEEASAGVSGLGAGADDRLDEGSDGGVHGSRSCAEPNRSDTIWRSNSSVKGISVAQSAYAQ